MRLCVGEGEGRTPAAAENVPGLDAEVLPELFDVGDKMLRRVVVKAGRRRALAFVRVSSRLLGQVGSPYPSLVGRSIRCGNAPGRSAEGRCRTLRRRPDRRGAARVVRSCMSIMRMMRTHEDDGLASLA